MRYRREDIVDRAIGALDERGVDELSMRNLAADLGVRPSALYHHVANKQELFAAVADRILARGRRATELVTWEAELRLVGTEVRDAMLAHRDGALLIAGVHASGAGAQEPELRMRAALERAGADEHLASVGARTLLHYVFGHTVDRQSRSDTDLAQQDFALGIGLILDGLAAALRRSDSRRSAPVR